MTAFKGKNVSDYWMAPAVKNLRIIYAATKYGWMEAVTFSNSREDLKYEVIVDTSLHKCN